MDENTVVVALIYVVVGALSCFYGYRFFRVMLALVGFAAGVLLTLALIDVFVIDTDADTIVSYAETIDELSAESSIVGFIVTVVIGLVAAILVQLFYKVGVFVLTAFVGAYITFALLSNNTQLNDDVRLFAILFMGGTVGVFAMRVERHVLVLSTAFVGAFLLVLAGYTLVAAQDTNLDQPFGDDAIGVSAGVVMLSAWLLLAIAGAYKQFDDADNLLDAY